MPACQFFPPHLVPDNQSEFLPRSGVERVVQRGLLHHIADHILVQDNKMDVDNPNEMVEKLHNGDIDESLYSRQL